MSAQIHATKIAHEVEVLAYLMRQKILKLADETIRDYGFDSPVALVTYINEQVSHGHESEVEELHTLYCVCLSAIQATEAILPSFTQMLREKEPHKNASIAVIDWGELS